MADVAPPPPPDPRLTAAAAVVQQLKILFSSRGVSALVVGGLALEEAWLDELTLADPLLGSIFTRHVYVPPCDVDAVEAFLRCHGSDETAESDLAAAVAFWTRGRYKALLRHVTEMGADGGARDWPAALQQVGRVLGAGWGRTRPRPCRGAAEVRPRCDRHRPWRNWRPRRLPSLGRSGAPAATDWMQSALSFVAPPLLNLRGTKTFNAGPRASGHLRSALWLWSACARSSMQQRRGLRKAAQPTADAPSAPVNGAELAPEAEQPTPEPDPR